MRLPASSPECKSFSPERPGPSSETDPRPWTDVGPVTDLGSAQAWLPGAWARAILALPARPHARLPTLLILLIRACGGRSPWGPRAVTTSWLARTLGMSRRTVTRTLASAACLDVGDGPPIIIERRDGLVRLHVTWEGKGRRRTAVVGHFDP